MSFLSNIFGGGDSVSSNDNSASLDFISDVTSTIGLNIDSSQSNYSEDEDGNISAQQNDNSLDFDFTTDSLLASVTDIFSSSDEASS